MSKIHHLADLSAGYAADWARMDVATARKGAVDAAARTIIAGRRRYETVGRALGIPWAIIGLLHMREASNDFACHLHNGDSLKRRTVHVPAGRLPTHEPPFGWEESAIDALRLDGLDKMGPWTLEAFAFAAERFNGFGPRNRGKRSGYLWAGSNVYDGGKYVEDNVWSASTWDEQLGVMPVLAAIEAAPPAEVIIPGTALPATAPTVADTLAAHPIAKAATKAVTTAAPVAPLAEATSTGSISIVSIVSITVAVAVLAGLGVWLWRRQRRLATVLATPIDERPQFENRAAPSAPSEA